MGTGCTGAGWAGTTGPTGLGCAGAGCGGGYMGTFWPTWAGPWTWFAGPCTASTNWFGALGLAGLGAFEASMFSLTYCLTKYIWKSFLPWYYVISIYLYKILYPTSLLVKSIWQILLK